MAFKKRITPAAATKAKPPAKPQTHDMHHPDIVYIPLDRLLPHEDNPNVMSESVFDALVEKMRKEGFDEPLLVRASPGKDGFYDIGSGHHRWKAAKVLGILEVPCIVKKWTDAQLRLELTSRNVLRGKVTNRGALKRLYDEVVKDFKGDTALAQKAMGFHEPKALDRLLEDAKKSLPPAARKKLDEAKETIKSVDDLSSVLNRIFKESGSDITQGYMVFSFGGKEHHYIQITDETNTHLHAVLDGCKTSGVSYTDAIACIMSAVASGRVEIEGVNLRKPSTVRAKRIGKK